MQGSEQISRIVEEVVERMRQEKKKPFLVPVGISNRHIHLSPEDLATLFGSGHQLTKLKDLKQLGEFAAQETVTLVGPKGIIQNVRILGPTRKQTQVEVSRTDSFALGVKAPVRESGKLDDSAGITLVGPKGSVTIKEGVICALRHIHMSTKEAQALGLQDRSMVKVQVPGERRMILEQVLLRVGDTFVLELHLDTDEANAAWLKNDDQLELVLD